MGAWGGPDTLKICRRSQNMFWKCHKMSHSFIQNCCRITLQVSHHEGWKTCVKKEGKTNSARRLKQLDPDPLILRQIYRLRHYVDVWCVISKPSSSVRDDGRVHWPPYDVNRQQYFIIGLSCFHRVFVTVRETYHQNICLYFAHVTGSWLPERQHYW